MSIIPSPPEEVPELPSAPPERETPPEVMSPTATLAMAAKIPMAFPEEPEDEDIGAEGAPAPPGPPCCRQPEATINATPRVTTNGVRDIGLPLLEIPRAPAAWGVPGR
jgi:hypothetical protein